MAIKRSHLEKQWYFRAARVLTWIVALSAFVAPALRKVCSNYSNVALRFSNGPRCTYPPFEDWVLDGLLNAIIWMVLAYIAWRLMIYVIWGGLMNDKKA